MRTTRTTAHGFTLIELLVVVATVGVLTGLLLPALAGGRDSARRVVCMSNQRQLWMAWSMYASDHAGKAAPHLAPGGTERVYWYGAEDQNAGRLDHSRGTLAAYLDGTPGDRSAYECPAQGSDSYREQGQFGGFTTTYGYNAYALAPATSGYSDLAGRRWPALHDFVSPSRLYVFGDALLALYDGLPSNSALLDPPMLFRSRRARWVENLSPTTAFRHGRSAGGTGFGVAVLVRADGAVMSEQPHPGARGLPEFGISSTTEHNDPGYVPGWRRWR